MLNKFPPLDLWKEKNKLFMIFQETKLFITSIGEWQCLGIYWSLHFRALERVVIHYTTINEHLFHQFLFNKKMQAQNVSR